MENSHNTKGKEIPTVVEIWGWEQGSDSINCVPRAITINAVTTPPAHAANFQTHGHTPASQPHNRLGPILAYSSKTLIYGPRTSVQGWTGSCHGANAGVLDQVPSCDLSDVVLDRALTLRPSWHAGLASSCGPMAQETLDLWYLPMLYGKISFLSWGLPKIGCLLHSGMCFMPYHMVSRQYPLVATQIGLGVFC